MILNYDFQENALLYQNNYTELENWGLCDNQLVLMFGKNKKFDYKKLL